MKDNFCFEQFQVDRLSQLVKHELIKLDIISQRVNLSDSTKLFLNDERSLYVSILNVLLKRC